MPSSLLEWSEFLSYFVTIIGLPLAIYVFLDEQRKEIATRKPRLISGFPTSTTTS